MNLQQSPLVITALFFFFFFSHAYSLYNVLDNFTYFFSPSNIWDQSRINYCLKEHKQN